MFSNRVTSVHWLSVELERKYIVHRVIFLGRTICCGNILQGMIAYVGDKAGLGQPYCGKVEGNFRITGGHMAAISCTCALTGLYVTIQPIIDSSGTGVTRLAVFWSGLIPSLSVWLLIVICEMVLLTLIL